MRAGVKRAECFWCHALIFWSTLHYYWYSADRSQVCPNGRVHLAQEIEPVAS
jgi:hypothetical protein